MSGRQDDFTKPFEVVIAGFKDRAPAEMFSGAETRLAEDIEEAFTAGLDGFGEQVIERDSQSCLPAVCSFFALQFCLNINLLMPLLVFIDEVFSV